MNVSANSTLGYREWLFQQIEERKQKVPSYSLRAFSVKVGVSAASLSQIISGKRPLTKKMALKIAGRLSLGPEETQSLLQNALKAKYEEASRDLGLEVATEDGEELRMDSFRLISDWYHYAILNLLKVNDVRFYPEWFGKRLGISVLEAHQAILRLKRLGLIEQKGRTWLRTKRKLKTSTDIADAAIRRYHYQNLSKAEESLDRDPVTLRDFGAITMAIDPRQLPKAKALVQRFRSQMADCLSQGEPERVYTFVTQLFPIDRKV